MDEVSLKGWTPNRRDVLSRSAMIVAALFTTGAGPRTLPLTTPGTNDCAVMKDWPTEYANAIPPVPPSFTRAETIAAGQAMATLFLADRNFALRYLDVVKLYKFGNSTVQPPIAPHGEYATSAYKPLIQEAYRVADYSAFNAHDFANIHHAAWLVLLQAFSCLVAFNPHESGSWSDPPKSTTGLGCGVSRGLDFQSSAAPSVTGTRLDLTLFDYHNIPNATGSYAVHASDITPPGF